ncbi:hypothetical protein [Streptomyces lasiicapitis]|uniref:hypothetical protein n=1 Tax=Streptomyces lasiicapitis TaxID=1923961 RepID=UPI003669494D
MADGLDPKNVIIAVSLLTGFAQPDPLTGLAWAGEAIVFAALIPITYIKYGIKSGKWADRHVGNRRRRLLLIPVIMASVGAGIAGMLWLDARSRRGDAVIELGLPPVFFWLADAEEAEERAPRGDVGAVSADR